jgi:O-methyltransferase involved in polyketide biosynthesis
MNLSKVSQTAILTLVCRVVEAEKSNPLFSDPMAVLCLQRLMSISSEEEKNRFTKWKRMYAGIQARDQRARALTVKNFDDIANRFISDHPGCTVVNLACGFDTRFWRIENRKCRYIELDLPAIIDLKGELLKDHLGYELIACSILDPTWIDQVTSHGSSDFLLLAEGLFMYLPKEDATRDSVAHNLSLIWPLRNTQRDCGNGFLPWKPESGVWMFQSLSASTIHATSSLMAAASSSSVMQRGPWGG